LSSNLVECAVKSVGNFIQNTLGYDSKKLRRKYRIGRHKRYKRLRIYRIRENSKKEAIEEKTW
jgi:hypothetical protein